MTFKRLEGPAGDALAMVTVVVVGTGLTVDRSVSEDVVYHAQPGVRHVHDGFLRPALPQYPAEAGLQGAVLGPARPGRRLDQRRAAGELRRSVRAALPRLNL